MFLRVHTLIPSWKAQYKQHTRDASVRSRLEGSWQWKPPSSYEKKLSTKERLDSGPGACRECVTAAVIYLSPTDFQTGFEVAYRKNRAGTVCRVDTGASRGDDTGEALLPQRACAPAGVRPPCAEGAASEDQNRVSIFPAGSRGRKVLAKNSEQRASTGDRGCPVPKEG